MIGIVAGTPLYFPPEVVAGRAYDQRVCSEQKIMHALGGRVGIGLRDV